MLAAITVTMEGFDSATFLHDIARVSDMDSPEADWGNGEVLSFTTAEPPPGPDIEALVNGDWNFRNCQVTNRGAR